MVNKIVTVVLVVCGLLVCLHNGLDRYTTRKNYLSSLSWPVVEGEVTASQKVQLDEFLSFRDCAFPKVDFKYDVNGSTYNSDNMKLGVACPSADLMVTALGNRYAPGKKIQVHYDPNDPGRSAALNISYMPKNSAVMKWLFFSTLFVFALIRYLYKFWEEAH